MDLQALKNTYNGKRVFLTGHTGFKGAWLLQVLHWLGADVKGYALAPENSFDLYNEINGDKRCYSSVTGDLPRPEAGSGRISTLSAALRFSSRRPKPRPPQL